MPMSRYEIRNEYGLADPELYQTADKDDPEALLEGIAMAGLVGLLRQLGDLAEFAAEIFHNLHDDVVATAARGHGLMGRVQQLEAEIPSMEKAFLSQTDHSSFFYRAGVDWHPYIRTDQNLVTQGDLPRFVMDSYEECREPPRLFLLDKFDVAGAGACLKRYTDPSFYKVESMDMSNANTLRERKILKAKRKVSRWKSEEVPETLPESHTKLHELFMEERVENCISKSSSRVKLKRRLPFDARTGKSCMEKLLRSSSPDHEVLSEASIVSISTPLTLIANEQDEPKSEVTEHRQPSPDRLSVRRKRSPSSSPTREKPMISNDIPSEANEMSQNNGSCESAIVVNAVSKREDSLMGYHSDDVSSEIDYVDATSTVETEMDTDSEIRAKGGSTSSNGNNQSLAPDAGGEHHDSRSDSQSIVYSLSEDGSSSPKKEMSDLSVSPSISAETRLFKNTSGEKFPHADIPEVVDSLSDQKSAEDFSSQQYSETMVNDSVFPELDAVSSNDSPPTVTGSDSEVVRKNTLSVRRIRSTFSSLDDEEKKATLIADHHSSVADSNSGKADDFHDPSEHPLDEADCKNACVSSANDCEPLPRTASLDNQCSGELDHELLEWPENLTGKCPDMTQNKDEIKPWVSNDDAKDEMEITSLNVSGETSQSSDQCNDVEDNHVRSLIDNQSCTVESNSMHMVDSPDLLRANLSFHGRLENPEEKTIIDETGEPLTSDSCEVLGLDGTCSEVIVLVPPSRENLEEAEEYNLCNSQEKLEVFSSNSFPTTEKTEEHVDVICSAPENLEEAAEVLCFTQEPEESAHDAPETSKEPAENSCHIPEEIEVSAEISCISPKKLKGTAETPFCDPYKFDEAIGNPYSRSQKHEEPVFSSPSEVPALDESGAEKVWEDSAETTSASISSDSVLDNNSLALNSKNMDAENMHDSEDLGVDEPENEENVPPEYYLESGFMEDEVDQTKVDTSVIDTVFLNGINHDHQKPEVAEATKLDTQLNLEIKNTLEVFHPTAIQSIPEKGNFDQEFCNGGSVLGSDFDAPLLGNQDPEDSLLSENIVLLSDKLDPELSEPSEVSRLQELQLSGGTESDSSHQEMPELHNQFSFSQLQRFPNYAFAPNFPPPDPFTGTDQINLTDLPPLPPLPPAQWRLGKLQQSLSAAEEPMPLKDSFPQEIPKPTDGFSISAASAHHSLVQIVLPETKEEKVEQSMLIPEAGPIHETSNITGNNKLQFSPKDFSISVANFSHESVDHPPTTENEPKKQLMVAPISDPEVSATEEEESVIVAEVVLTQSSLSGIDAPHETDVDLQQPEPENQSNQLVLPRSDIEKIPTEDYAVANGVQSLKARLPSPLIGDASILDKSKLRKVTERVRPELKKVDERDSFLQQIKSKSFNLRPTVPSRPSIRGPSTNLKVAAILERANAIRQALAGSDEDEDSWSDS